MFIQRPYNRFEIEIEDAPPFANTYSLDFDGIDDHLGLTTTLDLGINCTMSLWLKRDRTGTLEIYLGSSANSFAWLSYIATSNILYFKVGTTQYTFSASPIATIMNDTTNWINICWQRSGNSLELFLNGVSMQTRTGIGTVINTTLDTIGTNANGGSGFLGNIDEVACWDTNTINPADIYNGGTPTDLSLLATPPLSWYRNGDNGSYKSPQWLIPSDENKAKVSNYSMDFDGLRYMTVGSITLGVDNIVSLWLKRDVTNTQEALLGENTNSFNYFMLITATNEMYLRFGASVYVGYTSASVISVLNDTTNWINIVVVRTGNSVELFLNGISMGTGTNNNGVPGVIETRFDEVAAANGSFRTTGAFNNVAAWNVNTVLPSEIFNGGTPPDLSTLSTVPVNWWKMGDNSTWTPTTWNVPDEIGTNNGTIDFLDIFGRIGEAPNSENNAVSLNMDFVDVVTDTP